MIIISPRRPLPLTTTCYSGVSLGTLSLVLALTFLGTFPVATLQGLLSFGF